LFAHFSLSFIHLLFLWQAMIYRLIVPVVHLLGAYLSAITFYLHFEVRKFAFNYLLLLHSQWLSSAVGLSFLWSVEVVAVRPVRFCCWNYIFNLLLNLSCI